MMKKTTMTLLLLVAFMTAGVQTALAQSVTVSDGSPVGKWYAGISGGTSFGQATFRSITENKTHWGAQFGVFGGYQFSRLFSVEVLATTGRQSQTSLDCDPFWLSTDGTFSYAPVLGKHGHYYSDLRARTSWARLALQTNFDVLSLLTKPTSRWSLNLSPQVSLVTTRTKHFAGGDKQAFSRQWHLGLGGQAAVGYRIADCIGLQLYGGITCLTGDRFDNIHKHFHKSNFIWEGGLKVSYHFGKKKPAPVVEKPAVITEPEPQPVVEQKPVVEEKPAPVVEKPQPVAETVAPVVSDSVADISLPVIYFANNSSRLTPTEAEKLQAVVRMMQEQPGIVVAIYDYASNVGTAPYNNQLSLRRSNAVKTWLVQHGADAARLQPVEGRGIDRQAVNFRLARRVELIINEKNK